jgi:hypothetical protein
VLLLEEIYSIVRARSSIVFSRNSIRSTTHWILILPPLTHSSKMYLKTALLMALGFGYAVADEIHLTNCQNTGPSLPRDEYTVMAVGIAAALFLIQRVLCPRAC